MKKVSISIGKLQKKYGDFKALEIAAEIGADAVDFLTADCDYRITDSIFSKSDSEIREYYTKVKNHADKLGIEIGQTHGREEGFKNIKAEDDALLKNARLDCLATSALGAPVCIIHAVTTINMGPSAASELMHGLNFKMFSEMLKFAKEFGIKIATETFGDAVIYDCCDFFGNIDEFIKSYEKICSVDNNGEYFTICVDTGHSNKAMRFGNPTPGDVIRRLNKNVTSLHLHDNDTFTDQHKIPMTGTIDWNDVLNALDEIGYNGNYNLEIALGHFGQEFYIEEAEFAIKVMKNALAEHYKVK